MANQAFSATSFTQSITGIALPDPEAARAIIDPTLQLMMDAVHRYEGYVAQVLGDGIFALWLSLENSSFSPLCRKAMEWLSDDTTHFHYSL